MSLLDRFLSFSSPPEDDDPAYFDPLRQMDYQKATPLVIDAVRDDDPCAMAILATMHAFGRGVERNLQDAADWFRQSAVRGYVPGQAAYGACLASGMGVARNDREAALWLYRAGTGGSRTSVDMLADLVLQNQSLVGEHFSMQEFMDLVRSARRIQPAKLH